MQKEKINRKNKGITLIALVITIIVMLILVGVTVNVSLNGGLFSTAKEATEETQIAQEREELLVAAMGALGEDGEVDLEKLDSNLPEGFQKTGEGTYKSSTGNVFTVGTNGTITLVGSTEGGSGDDELAEGVTIIPYENLETEVSAEIKEAVDAGKISTVLKETITLNGVSTDAIAVIPTGYTVSTTDGEDSISGGLVIYDGTSSNRNNEFVWIPLGTEFNATYTSGNYSEPTTTSDDTQTILNNYYEANHYTIDAGDTYQNNINNAFAYKAHYAEMVTSVNKYKGYYVGRYETTIEGASIGSKANTTVLTVDKTISQTNNKECRWWGLYDAQRNSNVAGNGSIVQTNMIWGQQWDVMITFFGDKDYSANTVNTLATSGKQNAGQAKYTSGASTISDEICNIYDLRGNVYDWTAEANDDECRIHRGGNYITRLYAAYRWSQGSEPTSVDDVFGSRLTLYIK